MYNKLSKKRNNIFLKKSKKYQRKDKMNGGGPRLNGLPPGVEVLPVKHTQTARGSIIVFGRVLNGRRFSTFLAIGNNNNVELRHYIEEPGQAGLDVSSQIRTLTINNDNNITAVVFDTSLNILVIGDNRGFVSIFNISGFTHDNTFLGENLISKFQNESRSRSSINSITVTETDNTVTETDNILHLIIYAGNEVIYYDLNMSTMQISKLVPQLDGVLAFDVGLPSDITGPTVYPLSNYKFAVTSSDTHGHSSFQTWVLDELDTPPTPTDIETHRQRQQISCLKMHPKTPILISGDSLGVLRLWDIMNDSDEYLSLLRKNERYEGFLVAVAAHYGPVEKIVFHPNKFLFATKAGQEVKLWGLDKFFRTMTLLATIPFPTNVIDIAFHPNANCLVTSRVGLIIESFHFPLLDEMEGDIANLNDFGPRIYNSYTDLPREEFWQSKNPDEVMGALFHKEQIIRPNHSTIRGWDKPRRYEGPENSINKEVSHLLRDHRTLSCHGAVCSVVHTPNTQQTSQQRPTTGLPPSVQAPVMSPTGLPPSVQAPVMSPTGLPPGWTLETLAGQRQCYYHADTDTWSKNFPTGHPKVMELLNMNQKQIANLATTRARIDVRDYTDCVNAIVEAGSIITADFQQWSKRTLTSDLNDTDYFQKHPDYRDRIVRALLAIKAETLFPPGHPKVIELLNMNQKQIADLATTRARIDVKDSKHCVNAIVEAGIITADFQQWSKEDLTSDLMNTEYFQKHADYRDRIVRALLAIKEERQIK
jgi:WD40 repeat protein